MSCVAVLMCMAADADRPLALRAIASTAAGLREKDAIFLLIDGAASIDEPGFHSAAGETSLNVCFSPHRRGLAAGLNRLTEIALADPQWTYLARMDADDESLPDRFHLQREYFAEHSEVDVLGGLCREVDERGVHLRTKSMPLQHEQIVARLPRRNPLNHPTVMMRRGVFEQGLRYRTDVGLVEDWWLWVDAAAGGFRFANLDEVLLNFRRSNDFFKKRGGWKTAMAEWRVRRYARTALGKSSPANFCYAVAASVLRILPARLQSEAYRMAS
jgi:hypothetical protein